MGNVPNDVSEMFISHLQLSFVSLQNLHFPLSSPQTTRRKSDWKTPAELRREAEERMQSSLDIMEEESLKVVEIPGKGRGVKTRRNISKGDFIVEYRGDLMTGEIGRMMEQEYTRNGDLDLCYMLYFHYRSEEYAIDATSESSDLGRLINHSRKYHNSVPKVWELSYGDPRIIFEAVRDIKKGEEILYDYQRKHVRDSLEWLKE